MADRLVRLIVRGEGISTVAGQMTALGKSTAAAAKDMTGASREAAKFRAGLTSVGDAAGKFGLVAAAGLGAAVAASANFGQSMSKMSAATRATSGELDNLREAAMKAGEDTVFSASEAADAITNLAKAGVSTADILAGGLDGALSLAAAGELEVAEAAEIAAGAMTQFGLRGEDLNHVADLLAAGAGKANGEVTDLAQALSQSGLVANQVGLSIEETTGALAAFASSSLLGSDAGTSFKTMLGSLTPNSKEAAATMRELGINAYDAQGEFIGLAEFAGVLRDGMADLTVQQRQAAMETIFGSDAVRAASILYEQGADGIQEWIDKTNDAGYAAETAAIQTDNLKGDLEALGGSLETALIGGGASGQGPLRDLVQTLTAGVNAFNDLPGPIKTTATAMTGLAAVGGGSVWALSKVVNTVADVRGAMGNLGVTADGTRTKLGAVGSFLGGPWGIALGAGIGALGLFAAKQAEASAAVDAAKATLDEQTGSLTANTRAWAVKKLMDEGLLDTAKELGLNLEMVTNAALGDAEAAEYLASVQDRLEDELDAVRDATEGDTQAKMEATREAQNHLQAVNRLVGAVDSSTGAISDARREWELEKEAMGDASDAADEAERKHLESAASMVETAKAAGLGKKAMRELLKEYDLTPDQVTTLVKAEVGEAMRDVTTFADHVNSELAGIKDYEVGVRLGFSVGTQQKLYGDSYNFGGAGGSGGAGNGHGGPNLDLDVAASEFPEGAVKSAVQGLAQEWADQNLAFGASVLPKGSYRIGMPYLGYPGHYGADYPAAVGTPIYAAGAGTVARAMSMSGSYGNHVFLSHPGGVETRYAHMTDYMVSPGQMVLPGQLIGTVGSTGNSTGPHLHFEYRVNGSPINPATLGMFWSGGYTGAGGKYDPKGIVHGGEYVWNAETTAKYLPLLAALGGAGGPGDIDAQLDMLRLTQEINQLRKQLAADGKEAMKGTARKIAELELAQARQELRSARRAPVREQREQARALRSIELDVEGGASVAETREALREFRRDVREAGGEWTKELATTSHRLIDLAKQTAATERSLEQEMERRDELQAKIDDEIAALEQLRDTMDSFAQSVGGNFRGDAFGQAPEEGMSAVDALRARLLSDITRAEQFGSSLTTLADRGLSGGFFSELATSGNLDAAQQLAGLSDTALSELQGLWEEREQAAAQVGTFAAQQVYGQQLSAMEATLAKQQDVMVEQNAAIRELNQELRDLGREVREGAQAGVESLAPALREQSRAVVTGWANDMNREVRAR